MIIALLLIYKWQLKQGKGSHSRVRKPVNLPRRSIIINNGTGCHAEHNIKPTPRPAESLTETSAFSKSGPSPSYDYGDAETYRDVTEMMGLENNVRSSHAEYIEGFTSSVGGGLPTGSSSNVELEETGRSYGTSDFVGLTSRKWCKARQLAKPGEDSRVIPTHDQPEECNITLTDMI